MLAVSGLNHCTFTSAHRPHGKLAAKLDCSEQEEQDEAMEDIGEEEVGEESAAKKPRLDMEDAGVEELEQDQVQLKEEQQLEQQLEQEMDEGDEEEEEAEDGDEEEEEEENEELTKDRCGRPRLLALTHSSHGIIYQPPSSQK